jgi:hypothetical protein
MNPTFDSRHYPTSRLLSIHGYDHLPVVDDTLGFNLPRFRQHSGRLVAAGSRVWELWSPNSSQVAFYPGVPPPNLQLCIPSDERQRRYDGHLGRFDSTLFPQLLSEQRPWRGFILRQESGFKQRSQYPEFSLLHQNWRSISSEEGIIVSEWIDALMFRLNHLDAEMSNCSEIMDCRADLWNSRPLYPSVDQIVTLRHIRSFSIAVDQIGWILRGIKDRAAWLVMSRLVLADSVTLDMMRGGSIPPACEDYIGAWINGSDERDAVWATGKGMPCFVIHELTAAERRIFKTTPSSPDFLQGTDVFLLRPSHNGFDHIALRSGQVTPTPIEFLHPPAILRKLLPRDRDRSSATAQGWSGTCVGVTMPPSLTVEPSFPITLRVVDDEEYDIEALKKFNPADPRYAAPPLEYETLDLRRVPWLKPPPVQSVLPGKKWSRWIFDASSSSNPVVKFVGKKGKHKKYVYYDRENFRELGFSTPIEQPPGLTSDIKIFGLPAPAVVYVERIDLGWRQRKASRWVYPTRMPEKVGMDATPPELTSLAMEAGLSIHDGCTPCQGSSQDSTSRDKNVIDVADGFLNDLSHLISGCLNVSPTHPASSKVNTALAHITPKHQGSLTGPGSPGSPSADNDNVDADLMSANRSVFSLTIFFLTAYPYDFPSSPRLPSADNDNVDVDLMSANRSVPSPAIFFLAAYGCQVLK